MVLISAHKCTIINTKKKKSLDYMTQIWWNMKFLYLYRCFMGNTKIWNLLGLMTKFRSLTKTCTVAPYFDPFEKCLQTSALDINGLCSPLKGLCQPFWNFPYYCCGQFYGFGYGTPYLVDTWYVKSSYCILYFWPKYYV